MMTKQEYLEKMEEIHDKIIEEIEKIGEKIVSCSNEGDVDSCGMLLKKRNELVTKKQKIKTGIIEEKKKLKSMTRT